MAQGLLDTRLGALGRGVIGALALALGLGIAATAADLVEQRAGATGIVRQVVQAVVCTGVTVPLIVLLRRRLDRRPMTGLGLSGPAPALRTFGMGALVTAVAASAVLGVGSAMGWMRFTVVSWTAALGFLAVDMPIAFLFEALPEELALRGYAYRSLNVALRRWSACMVTIVLFLVVPAAASVVQAAATASLGGPAAPVALAPAGMDAASYLILLTVFGAALLAARIATGSLWTSIGLHLTFLAVNRFILVGERVTGVSASMTTPDAIVLIPAYVLIAAAGFLRLARLRGRRIGWRDRDPEH